MDAQTGIGSIILQDTRISNPKTSNSTLHSISHFEAADQPLLRKLVEQKSGNFTFLNSVDTL